MDLSDNELNNILTQLENDDMADEHINIIETNINKICDIDVGIIEYRLSETIGIKHPKKLTEIEKMDLYHREVKRKINEKELDDERKKRNELDILYSCGIKKQDIDRLYLTGLPEPMSESELIKIMNNGNRKGKKKKE